MSVFVNIYSTLKVEKIVFYECSMKSSFYLNNNSKNEFSCYSSAFGSNKYGSSETSSTNSPVPTMMLITSNPSHVYLLNSN